MSFLLCDAVFTVPEQGVEKLEKPYSVLHAQDNVNHKKNSTNS